MNQSTKQRVVGTVVLLALGLIFLPTIFDGEGSYQRPLSSRIPEPPVMRVMPDPIPERPVIQADAATTVRPQPAVIDDVDPEFDLETLFSSLGAPEIADSVDDLNSVIEQVPPSLDESGIPFGWSIRLGSFSNTTNAQNLTQRLLSDGYRAYTREINTAQGKLTAVYVGPQVERDKADQLKEQLQTEFKLSGIVVRFEVDSI